MAIWIGTVQIGTLINSEGKATATLTTDVVWREVNGIGIRSVGQWAYPVHSVSRRQPSPNELQVLLALGKMWVRNIPSVLALPAPGEQQ